jgi:hypothetical protein
VRLEGLIEEDYCLPGCDAVQSGRKLELLKSIHSFIHSFISKSNINHWI